MMHAAQVDVRKWKARYDVSDQTIGAMWLKADKVEVEGQATLRAQTRPAAGCVSHKV